MGNDDSPSRWRGLWWKILLGLFAVAIVLVTIVLPLSLKVWAANEKAGVERRVAAIRAAGEPILPEDFVEPAVADENNLVVPIRAAIAAMDRDPARKERRDELDRDKSLAPPLSNEEIAILEEVLDANGATLAELAKMDGRTGVAWGEPFRSMMAKLNDDTMTDVRKLANLLRDAALLAITERRWSDAVTLARRLEPLAEAISGKRSLVEMLVATGIRGMQADLALKVSRQFDASSDAEARRSVRTLIAELLDETATDRTIRLGFVSERASTHDVLKALASGQMPPGMNSNNPSGPSLTNFGKIAGFAWRADNLNLDSSTELLAILDASDLAGFRARAGKYRAIVAEAGASKLNVLAAILLPSLERAVETGFKLRTDRRLAATALAIRLYQFDHDNARPPTLDALVPAYLPAVPLDAIDGQPLRYDAKRAILWTVREPGADHGGVAATTQMSGRERNQTTDDVRPLDPPPATTTQATE